MRITVVGAGAIGGTIGAHLARSGEDVLFVDVAKEHVDAINQRGLTITGLDEFTVHAPAITPEGLSGTLECVFLAVKAHFTEGAVRQLMPFLGPRSVLVSIQNGLNERLITSLIGAQRTIGAHVNFGSDYISPGNIYFGSAGTIFLGELDGSVSDRLRLIHQKLSLFAEAEITQNIWGVKWSKLCLTFLNAATAMVDADVVDIMSPVENQRLMVALMSELVRVPMAAGVRLESFDGFRPDLMAPKTPAELRAALDSLEAMRRDYWDQGKRRTGVWRDLAVRKRKTEVGYRSQEVYRTASDHGLETPMVRALVRMIEEIESGARPQSSDNLRELEKVALEHHLLDLQA